jgi:hypothetical protein
MTRAERFHELYHDLATAPAGSDALDVRIVAFFGNAIVKPYPPTDDFGPRDKWQFWSEDGHHFLGNEHKIKIPPLTRSVDAVLTAITELPNGWRVRDVGQISRNGAVKDTEYGWAASIWRTNDRISSIVCSYIGASDGWTPATAALALAAIYVAARYAEEIGENVWPTRAKETV